MRTLIAIILCIGLIFCIAACSTPANAADSEGEEQTETLPRMIKVVDRHPRDSMMIYVDTETRVMYAVYVSNVGATMTVMVDPEGKPLLWEGELQ